MAGSTSYEIIGDDHADHYRSVPNENGSAVDIMASFNPGLPELPTPNCKGVRWHYIDALCKTLEELDPVISRNLEQLQVPIEEKHVIIKDEGDGMGEVSIHKEKPDRYLPDKAFRFSF